MGTCRSRSSPCPGSRLQNHRHRLRSESERESERAQHNSHMMKWVPKSGSYLMMVPLKYWRGEAKRTSILFPIMFDPPGFCLTLLRNWWHASQRPSSETRGSEERQCAQHTFCSLFLRGRTLHSPLSTDGLCNHTACVTRLSL